MATKAVKRKRDEEPVGEREWQAPGERAPSILRTEPLGPIRAFALFALKSPSLLAFDKE